MLSSDFLFPRFLVVPLANPSNFSHCKCFSSRMYTILVYMYAIVYSIVSFSSVLDLVLF